MFKREKWNCHCNLHLIFHIHRILVCLGHSAASPSHILLSIWKIELQRQANPLKLYELCFLLLFCLYVVPHKLSKFREQVGAQHQLCSSARQIACCRADWGLQHTKHEKCGLPGPTTGLVGPALPDQPREKGMAQSARQGHWSDEKIIPPPSLPLDLMRRQTICEQWQSQIGPKGY